MYLCVFILGGVHVSVCVYIRQCTCICACVFILGGVHVSVPVCLY